MLMLAVVLLWCTISCLPAFDGPEEAGKMGAYGCHAGDSDDGIVTRSVMYLYEQIQKRPKGAAPVTIR